MSSELTPHERMISLLSLAQLARNRFQEVESMQWKVNLSIWALLAAVVVACWTATPPRQLGPLGLLLAFAPLLHVFALYNVKLSQSYWRTRAERYFSVAHALLAIEDVKDTGPMPHPDTTRLAGYDKIWMTLETGTTLLVAAVVIVLVW